MEAVGLSDNKNLDAAQAPDRPKIQPSIASPTPRITRLLKESCAPTDVQDATRYLASRGLLPLPNGCKLRAHRALEYYLDGKPIGRYPGLIAAVRDVAGELVTAHCTYLEAGRKLETYSPRKILSRMTGRDGCAVRLMPIDGDTLGIAEGIETALAAARLHRIPTWAAINTSLLAKFTPPAGARRLVIFADNDAPGQNAALALMERLENRVAIEIRMPKAPNKDWNDVLMRSREETHADEAAGIA
jgi:putative DNA primase/helicase